MLVDTIAKLMHMRGYAAAALLSGAHVRTCNAPFIDHASRGIYTFLSVDVGIRQKICSRISLGSRPRMFAAYAQLKRARNGGGLEPRLLPDIT